MYYEYFRERAASCRRDAERENAWLSRVSLEMADMFDDMADDTLAREFGRDHQAAAAMPDTRHTALTERWTPAMLQRNYLRWRHMLHDLRSGATRLSRVRAADAA